MLSVSPDSRCLCFKRKRRKKVLYNAQRNEGKLKSSLIRLQCLHTHPPPTTKQKAFVLQRGKECLGDLFPWYLSLNLTAPKKDGGCTFLPQYFANPTQSVGIKKTIWHILLRYSFQGPLVRKRVSTNPGFNFQLAIEFTSLKIDFGCYFGFM